MVGEETRHHEDEEPDQPDPDHLFFQVVRHSNTRWTVVSGQSKDPDDLPDRIPLCYAPIPLDPLLLFSLNTIHYSLFIRARLARMKQFLYPRPDLVHELVLVGHAAAGDRDRLAHPYGHVAALLGHVRPLGLQRGGTHDAHRHHG